MTYYLIMDSEFTHRGCIRIDFDVANGGSIQMVVMNTGGIYHQGREIMNNAMIKMTLASDTVMVYMNGSPWKIRMNG